MAGKSIARQPTARAAAYAAALAERREHQRRERLALISTLDCLQPASEAELVRLLDLAVLRAFLPGTRILSDMQPGKYLHFIIQGSVRLILHDKDGREVLLGVLGRGDCYGEGPLFGDLFRRAGVVAETSCMVVQFQLEELQDLLPSMPQLQSALRQVYRQRLIESTLGRVPLFSRMSAVERLNLAGLMQPLHFARGDLIMRQGEPGDSFYLVEAGHVIVERDGQTMASLDEGDFFGEISLLCDTSHNASCRAMTPTDVLVLPGPEFHHLLEQRPDIEQHLRDVVEERLNNALEKQNNREQARRVALAINHGLRRGSHLLVRTPELCPPDCRICEQACAGRHGQTRIHLNGVQFGELDILDTCRQCHVGAECVEACPVNAFEWNERGALTITEACTGCGACVEACPYQAVSSVPRAPNGKSGLLWQLWSRVQQGSQRLLQHDIIPIEPKYTHRADKCDFCVGYSDLACLSQCPTGSLKLVPVEEVFPL